MFFANLALADGDVYFGWLWRRARVHLVRRSGVDVILGRQWVAAEYVEPVCDLVIGICGELEKLEPFCPLVESSNHDDQTSIVGSLPG